MRSIARAPLTNRLPSADAISQGGSAVRRNGYKPQQFAVASDQPRAVDRHAIVALKLDLCSDRDRAIVGQRQRAPLGIAAAE